MRQYFQRMTTPVSIWISLVLVMVAGIVWLTTGSAQAQSASSGRLVTIHDRGIEKVILTNATTIGQALNDADIRLDENDRVEPRVSEKLLAQSYTVNIYRARPVLVVDGALRQKVVTAQQTAEKIAADAGVDLQDEDETTLKTSDDIVVNGAGLELVINRATAFTLVLYGKKVQAYTQESTVGAMLRSKQITIGASDTVSVTLNAPMVDGMVIELWRNGKQTIAEDQEIEFEIEKIHDADRPAGFREIKTPGTKGKKSVTYEVMMKNGQELSRKEIQSVVVAQPKKQVEVVGAKPSFSGDFAAALAKLRACEAGGNYANKRNPLYRGAYQFGYGTWANYGGYYDPADAPPAVQDEAARNLYERRGWQPWPHCGSSLPDTYR
ncbi:MAG: ubiquitin-like domain-containing protein [Candidatus Saccharimonadales bacterium]